MAEQGAGKDEAPLFRGDPEVPAEIRAHGFEPSEFRKFGTEPLWFASFLGDGEILSNRYST